MRPACIERVRVENSPRNRVCLDISVARTMSIISFRTTFYIKPVCMRVIYYIMRERESKEIVSEGKCMICNKYFYSYPLNCALYWIQPVAGLLHEDRHLLLHRSISYECHLYHALIGGNTLALLSN